MTEPQRREGTRFVAVLPSEAGRTIGGCLMGKHVVMACDGGAYMLVLKGDGAARFERIESQYGPVTPMKYMDGALDLSKPQEERVGRPVEWDELSAGKWTDAKTLEFDIKQ